MVPTGAPVRDGTSNPSQSMNLTRAGATVRWIRASAHRSSEVDAIGAISPEKVGAWTARTSSYFIVSSRQRPVSVSQKRAAEDDTDSATQGDGIHLCAD